MEDRNLGLAEGDRTAMSRQKHSTEIVNGLLDGAAYPWTPDSVRLIETHISWVFLAGPFVIKVKRPVHFDFVDHSTIDRRQASCLEEVRLNQRLTDGVYLDVVPIVRAIDGIRVSGDGEVVDWATLMRRLPADAMLDRVLDCTEPPPGIATQIADVLIPFHSLVALPCDGALDEVYKMTTGIILDNLTELQRLADEELPVETFGKIEREMRRWVEHNHPGMLDRISGGFVRDGHGDLRCEHICLENERVQIFDCVEFNQSIRCADVASDLAFLLMDLQRLGRSDLARELVGRYSAAGIELPPQLFDFYMAHRALVRVKTELLGDRSDSLTYLGLALQAVARIRPVLVMMTGLSGTGKSTLARMLGSILGAPVFASDRIRKEMAGIEGSANTDWQEGIYSPEWNEQTYNSLFELASNGLLGGTPVILDAAFLNPRLRERAAELAREVGVELVVVETVCSAEIVHKRLEQRRRNALSISDADVQIYEKQRERVAVHPPSIPDRAHHVVVDTAAKSTSWIDPVIRELFAMGSLIPGISDLP